MSREVVSLAEFQNIAVYFPLNERFPKGAGHCFCFRQGARRCNRPEFSVFTE
jgi:hypothetical protein